MVKTENNSATQNTSMQNNLTEEISKKYDVILKKYENHTPIDFKSFQFTKPEYFEKFKIGSLFFKIEKYLMIKFKYHLMMYGPIILFFSFQFYYV